MRVGLLMAVNEVVRLSRVRSAMLMLFGLPLLLIFLLGNALDQNIKPVKVSLYIGDAGELGQAMQAFLASEPVKQRLVLRMSDSDGAVQEDLRSGRADYGFSMPPDFSEEVRSGKGELHSYPGRMPDRNLTAAAVINGFVQETKIRQSAAMVGTAKAASVQIPDESPAATGASASMVNVGTLVAGGNVAFGHVSSLQYYSVAYLIMFLLFSGMSAAISLTEEREKGTLQRLYAMPVSMNSIVFGKLAGILAMAFIQAAFIVTFTKVIYGVDWGSDYTGIALICLLTSIAAVCLAVIIASFVRSRKGVESIYSLIVVMMTFFSGGMVANLGSTVTEIGKFSINHWANESLRQLMSGGSLSGNWQAVLTLSAIAAGLVWISAFRFRKAVEV
jgi:ABC-2 type transport system permease protein